ncbi:MAG: GTPase [Gaiellaceae bacterium]
MPHRTQMQVIKRRLLGKEGSERARELRTILAELPGYRSGPYAEIRKWVTAELERTRARARVVHRDSIAVRREGAAQVALVGMPNVGKSSLLQALSSIQIRTGDYAFTTLRPVPSLTRIHGVLVQLVEIPGLLAGASEDRGGGRALLGVLRAADAIVLCHAADLPQERLSELLAELEAANIAKPSLLALTRSDEVDDRLLRLRRAAFPGLPTIAVSVLDDASLDALREGIWRLTGLIAIRTRHRGVTAEQPLALPQGATVGDAALKLHAGLETATGARVWGASARFPGQRVGLGHELSDGDTVEILR